MKHNKQTNKTNKQVIKPNNNQTINSNNQSINSNKIQQISTIQPINNTISQQTYYNIGQLKIKRPTKRDPVIKPCYQLRDFSDLNVYINDQKYQGLVRQCFTKAVSAQFRLLNLQRNLQSQILKQISQISFKSLRVLQLSNNNIQTIQPLGYMDMRGLRVLDLRENFILQARPLAKLYTRSISQLKIGLNLILTLQCMARMKFRVNQGNRDLSIMYQTPIKPYISPVNDLSFLAKLDNPKQLTEQWINVYHKRIINNPKFYAAIKRRNNQQKTIVLTTKIT